MVMGTLGKYSRSVSIIGVLEILCVAAMFFAVVIESALDGMKDSLVGFVHS